MEVKAEVKLEVNAFCGDCKLWTPLKRKKTVDTIYVGNCTGCGKRFCVQVIQKR